MSGISLSDNSCFRFSDIKYNNTDCSITDNDIEILKEISFKSIYDDNLIILKKQNDLKGHNKIFEINDNFIQTNNLMGFISYKDLTIKINSRFATSDNKDYFLHYMLCKVFNINVSSLENSIENENNTFEFVLYFLFIYHLKRALNQGLYKKYKRVEYNDSRVRGVINFNKQIRYNTPFNGKISYTTREYSFDNEITQLIRHTIEYLKTKEIFNSIAQREIKDYISQIIEATHSYNKRDRVSIINKNLKKLNHPYFYEYEPLRVICLKILKRESFKYESSNNKVNGILFDGAYLWEEYLWSILKTQDIKHSENKTFKNGISLLEKAWEVYPDFYKEEKIVLDAKYKRLLYKNKKGEEQRNIQASDKHQIVSYSYTLNTKKAYFIFPTMDEDFSNFKEIGSIEKINCKVGTFGFFIPMDYDNFIDFKNKIKIEEDNLKTILEL